MPNHKRLILLIEDDHATRVLCKKTVLRQGWDYLEAETMSQGLEILKDTSINPSLVLLDFGLPDGEPWPVLEITKRQSRSIPVIVATGMGDETLASKCINKGAVDYIIKSGNYWELLPPAIERAIAVTQAINDASRLAAIVNASPDPMYALDIEGKIESWNPAAERMFGHRADTTTNCAFSTFINEKKHARLERAITKAAHGKSSRFRCEKIAADGTLIPVSLSVSPIIDNHDAPVGIAVAERDLRPQLEAEAFREKAQTLTKINQELDQFAAVVAHDLQSPLGTASLQLDMLANMPTESTDADTQESINEVHELIKRSCKMIDRILQYARESNVNTNGDVLVDANKACQSALDGIKPNIDEHAAKIHIGKLQEFYFDELHLVRIFQNLINNAIKYRHPERTPNISINDSSDANSNIINIDISDNSRGIPDDQKDAIFALFKRANVENKHQPDGNGIGLAVCRKLIEARGGSLTLHQSTAAGSIFRISVPKPRENDDQSGQHQLP